MNADFSMSSSLILIDQYASLKSIVEKNDFPPILSNIAPMLGIGQHD